MAPIKPPSRTFREATLLYRKARDAHKDFDKVLDTFEDGIRRIQKLVRKVEVKR